MRKSTNTFSFEVPDDWETFADGRQLVAHGPRGEEIILSSWAVTGPEGVERDRFVEEILNAACRSMESAADNPELQVSKPFARDADAGGMFPCWTLIAETRQQDVLFAQAAIRGSAAVILATFESPYGDEHLRRFSEFLASFGPPPIELST